MIEKSNASMLRRIGKKTKLLPKLLNLFPQDIKTFIDLFMGSGAVSFAMVDRVKYIIANDNDSDIFNLFMVIRNQKDELIKSIKMMPIHQDLFMYWKKNYEHDPIWKATRFLMLSNFGKFGGSGTLGFGNENSKSILLVHIDEIFQRIECIQFMNCDFRDVLQKITNRDKNKNKTFVYADPPYLDTKNNYQHSFKIQDTRDLFDLLVSSGLRFAISEFDNPKILKLSDTYKLKVTILGERQNIKNRRTEILITNYEPIQISLFNE